MNFVASSPSAKEAKMLDYTCKITYSDETFAVSTFPASSYAEAIALCKQGTSEVRSVMVLGTIDRQPQTFLAW